MTADCCGSGCVKGVGASGGMKGWRERDVDQSERTAGGSV